MELLAVYKCLADESRLRVLSALRTAALNVQELTQILSLSQPTISHHLRVLQTASLVHSKKDGTRVYYSLAPDGAVAKRLVQPFLDLMPEVLPGSLGRQLSDDMALVRRILEGRRDSAWKFFETTGTKWNSLREDAQRNVPYLQELAKKIPQELRIAELGCGTGSLLAAILPRRGTTIAVDYSPAMLEAARGALGATAREVDFRLGYIEHLPIPDASLELAICSMVFHHLADPVRAIREVGRVLDVGGQLLIADLTSHTDEALRERYAHLWLGFDPSEMGEWLKQEGFEISEVSLFGEREEVFFLTACKRPVEEKPLI